MKKFLLASVLLVALVAPAAAKDQQTQTPHVGDVLVPVKPGTEIVTNTLAVPKLASGHVPAKVCTDHAQHVLETLKVTLPSPSGTVLLMTGIKTSKNDVTFGWVTGWTVSDFSVEVRCQMDHDVVFFVVAGPNYEDGTASAILGAIQKAWNEGERK